jgi:hypothetical protein
MSGELTCRGRGRRGREEGEEEERKERKEKESEREREIEERKRRTRGKSRTNKQTSIVKRTNNIHNRERLHRRTDRQTDPKEEAGRRRFVHQSFSNY